MVPCVRKFTFQRVTWTKTSSDLEPKILCGNPCFTTGRHCNRVDVPDQDLDKMYLVNTTACLSWNILAAHTATKCPPVAFWARGNTAKSTSISSGLYGYSSHDILRWRPGYPFKRVRSLTLSTQYLEGETTEWTDGIEMDSQGKVRVCSS